MALQRITCPSCGASRFDHDAEGKLVCAHCGTSFGAPQRAIDCPACGVENPGPARKCMNCGLSLGHICPVCNYHNPSSADHCLQCATPLDALSKVLMRTGQGRDLSKKVMKEDLVRTKGEDAVFMEHQRVRLEEEEQERLRNLSVQQSSAVKQQRTLMIVTLLAGSALVCGLIYLLTN